MTLILLSVNWIKDKGENYCQRKKKGTFFSPLPCFCERKKVRLIAVVSLANLHKRPEALARYYVTSHWQTEWVTSLNQ